MPQSLSFTVDTHVFRELGELLVGRDSTALLELIKNCYDADATHVVVTAADLADRARGRVVIRDNGCGMDEERFRLGFLRIASRFKEIDRRSDFYRRRVTGSKGIGRLAAHKLAMLMEVDSVRGNPGQTAKEAIKASIDWEKIESRTTLNELVDEITLESVKRTRPAPSGTTISLSKLRRPWDERERARFIAECRSFQPPSILTEALPSKLFGDQLLFGRPQLRDASSEDPGCSVDLEGDFSEGDNYWEVLLTHARWVVEIDCKSDKRTVKYAISPTLSTKKENPAATRREFSHPHPDPESGPFFQARILIRSRLIVDKLVRGWAHQTSGIRVYLEGFRVLPYGDRGDDWLSLDANTARRSWDKNPITESMVAGESGTAGDWQLFVLPNNSYTGAVFLTQDDAPTLRMLVNREGFVAEKGYDVLVDIVKRALDLATRTRAAARRENPSQKKGGDGPSARLSPTGADTPLSPATLPPRSEAIETAKSSLMEGLREARDALTKRNDLETTKIADRLVVTQKAAAEVIRAAESSEDSAAMSRVLSSLGTQMASFVHEINGMLGSATAVYQSLGRLREDRSLPTSVRSKLTPIYKDAGDLRRQIERQAAYMVEITSTDARRRRSRQPLGDRFDAATRLVAPAIDRRGIRLRNEIPKGLKSPPMFPAELTVVFSNLLTNAVKAAAEDGEILARGSSDGGRQTVVIENSGAAVDLGESERWFRPFESTTAEVDSALGQGMGLGLTITRDILEQYGATVRFVPPSVGFATAVEVQFHDVKDNQ
ncbi:sensor histidine kinase [Paludisphaera rhizosphaerae]|uniref:sensor histidine kinase n=1 Tax=Paludisphaera rhizosphaerae TaxID=2711216 RepID=UPI0013EDE963|nr:ATP-binding protein [Paludisphaera rhizosphaerae]